MVRLFIAAVILASSTAVLVHAQQPNVIVILADDLGYSDLGCYGSEIETPNLDALAAGGLRYTQFYNTGRCWPTRASLLTGYYPHQVHRDRLPELGGGSRGKRQKWARLLPDFLKPHGYKSYHSGKWHIDGKCLAAGFDRSFYMKNEGNYFTNKGNVVDDKPVKKEADETDYYATTSTVDHAIDCLKEHARDSAEQPFFQYVAFIAPHFPLHAKAEDIEKYADRYNDGWEKMRSARHARLIEMGLVNTKLSAIEPDLGPPYDFPDAIEKLGPGEVNRPLPWSKLSQQQQKFQATKMAIHAAMVDRMDQEIGRLVEHLKQSEQFANTMILFLSDNGASAEIMVRHGGHDPDMPMGSEASYLCLGPGFSSACNTPFRRHKTWTHEGGISSPLIVHWPKGISAKGELRTTPAHTIDIVPTIFEVAKIEKPNSWQGKPIPAAPGKSLAATFSEDANIEREAIWWRHEGHRAIRVGNFKLVAAEDDPWALYDLSDDRAESNDLSTTMPATAKALKSRWKDMLERFRRLASKTAKAK